MISGSRHRGAFRHGHFAHIGRTRTPSNRDFTYSERCSCSVRGHDSRPQITPLQRRYLSVRSTHPARVTGTCSRPCNAPYPFPTHSPTSCDRNLPTLISKIGEQSTLFFPLQFNTRRMLTPKIFPSCALFLLVFRVDSDKSASPCRIQLRKAQCVAEIAEKSGLNKTQAEAALAAFTEVVMDGVSGECCKTRKQQTTFVRVNIFLLKSSTSRSSSRWCAQEDIAFIYTTPSPSPCCRFFQDKCLDLSNFKTKAGTFCNFLSKRSLFLCFFVTFGSAHPRLEPT